MLKDITSSYILGASPWSGMCAETFFLLILLTAFEIFNLSVFSFMTSELGWLAGGLMRLLPAGTLGSP